MGGYVAEGMAELNELLAEHHVILPDGLQETSLPDVRRPLVLYRGKPITREQVFQLITGEEPLFGAGNDSEECCYDPREGRGVLKNIFYRQGYEWLSTWVYSDGTIGGNLIYSGKYPEIFEILPDYLHLAERYPFLDMVISYTTHDECCCYDCDAFEECEGYETMRRSADCKYKECIPYLDLISKYNNKEWNGKPDFEELYFRSWDTGHIRRDVGDSVVLTIWVHGGKTEVLFGGRARAKFTEYDKMYYSPEYGFMFSSDLYSPDLTCICDKAFVGDCFEYLGKPRELCDEYVKRGFISPFNESAQVVTKDWVISQYRAFISRGV